MDENVPSKNVNRMDLSQSNVSIPLGLEGNNVVMQS